MQSNTVTPKKSSSQSQSSSHPHSPGASFVTATTVVSLTAVVDALESQRKELSARNRELELQVRDLLLALKKQVNSSAGGGARSGERGGGSGGVGDAESARSMGTNNTPRLEPSATLIAPCME